MVAKAETAVKERRWDDVDRHDAGKVNLEAQRELATGVVGEDAVQVNRRHTVQEAAIIDQLTLTGIKRPNPLVVPDMVRRLLPADIENRDVAGDSLGRACFASGPYPKAPVERGWPEFDEANVQRVHIEPPRRCRIEPDVPEGLLGRIPSQWSRFGRRQSRRRLRRGRLDLGRSFAGVIVRSQEYDRQRHADREERDRASTCHYPLTCHVTLRARGVITPDDARAG